MAPRGSRAQDTPRAGAFQGVAGTRTRHPSGHPPCSRDHPPAGTALPSSRDTPLCPDPRTPPERSIRAPPQQESPSRTKDPAEGLAHPQMIVVRCPPKWEPLENQGPPPGDMGIPRGTHPRPVGAYHPPREPRTLTKLLGHLPTSGDPQKNQGPPPRDLGIPRGTSRALHALSLAPLRGCNPHRSSS